MPVAAAVKVAVCPTATVWLDGCMLMTGAAFGAALTVRLAALLVAVPAMLVNTARYWEPLMAVVVAGVV